ncbi:Na+/H+ antiporter subunit E [Aestuariivirga sp.]|uniref:Na+/H+ antiporter subunit E n=1 Tax=Aestuariivirga sp. TaxID=2650926 RepID=UPI00391A3ED3
MPRSATWAFLLRWAFYMLFWIVLAGMDAKDMAAGAAASALASWASLKLLAPGELSLKPARALLLFLRFLGQSIAAGVAVARIALSPAMPLRPGLIGYRTSFAEGTRRQAFTTFASLLPGTLPSGGDGRGGLAVHCLDEAQPVAVQLAEEEERFREAFSREARS